MLAGQSNMSGRGALRASTPEERTPDPAIRVYGNDGAWRPALDPLDAAAGQIDTVSADAQAAVGPGLPFARAMRRLTRRPVDLVPCAKGGSSIRRWRPAEGRNTLYGSCVARTKEVGRRISGLLWYQGESDAESLEAAANWSAAFAGMVERFRRDLASPTLPIVLVQLADPPQREDRARRYPGWQTVQDAQADIRLRCVAMVSAMGLARNQDELHLSTEGQRVLGPMLARAMRALQRRGCR